MKTQTQIVAELRAEAKKSGTSLRFRRDGKLWVAEWPNGKQAWCGTLTEIRNVAAGKAP